MVSFVVKDAMMHAYLDQFKFQFCTTCRINLLYIALL